MKYVITIVVLVCTVSSLFSEPTKDSNDPDLKQSTIISFNDHASTPDTWRMPQFVSLWVDRPDPMTTQSKGRESQNLIQKQPHLVTRLAKPLTFGFDPFFDKGHFEPFERRQKPVTLVNFRKNGMQPRKVVKSESDSADVAEQQSSFNDISSMWRDEPGMYI